MARCGSASSMAGGGSRKMGRAARAAPLPAKLRPPPSRVRTIERRALRGALRATSAPLVLVCAPAGFGKTTVLRQWTEADDRPVAWVRLDAADTDPVVLLIYLTQALATVASVDPTIAECLELAAPPIQERVLPLLADSLVAARPFVLVLDDAHVVRGDKPWEVVAFLLRSLPEGAQLAVGTRSDPPLPLARLRACGDLSEFRVQDLALDHQETGELLRLHGCASDEETVKGLRTATEGWATGVHLACLTAAGLPAAEWLPRVSGTRREIATYLTSEVLERQPREVQDFLLRTSVLDELTPELCRLVAGEREALLSRIAREDLFILPLDEEETGFRYHHLFAEMLEAELERRDPGRRKSLHRAAAGWYAAHDDPDEAVSHLLAAGDHAAAGDIVAAAWPTQWGRGRAETVRRWLEAFTDREILAHPALTLTAGWVYTALDAGPLGERWGRAACDAAVGDDASPDGAASLASSQALLRATVAPDGVRRMRVDAELAARLEVTPGTSWHADAEVALGVARWLSGSTQRALGPLTTGAREGSVVNHPAEIGALGYLALIASDAGDWAGAAEYEGQAAARTAELGFGTHRRCLPMLLARVRLLARDGDAGAGAAEGDVRRLLERMVPHPWMALLADVVLGEAALGRRDEAAAEAHARAATARLARYPDAGILRGRAERLRAAVERARLADPPTPAERRVLELLPTHLTDERIAERLVVSRNTVKTHLKSLYRKLGVRSRAEAVERAREAGLLPPV